MCVLEKETEETLTYINLVLLEFFSQTFFLVEEGVV